jgi:hypothetical protein
MLTVLNRSAVSAALSWDSRGTFRTGQIRMCPGSSGLRLTRPKDWRDGEMWKTWEVTEKGPNLRFGGSRKGDICDFGELDSSLWTIVFMT